MSIEAFILAGGRSSRLGRNKALEHIGGRTLAERAFESVRNSAIANKICFVAGNRVDLAIEARRLNAHFVFDVIEGRGPLGGLHTALYHAASEWVFVLACDLPFVTAELIGRLAEFRDEEHGAVIPEQPDGRPQPLCAFYRVATAKPIVEEIVLLHRVPPPMHEVVSFLAPRIVTPAEYNPITVRPVPFFSNINTESDLTEARELLHKLV